MKFKLEGNYSKKIEGNFDRKESLEKLFKKEKIEMYLMTRKNLDYNSTLKVMRILENTGLLNENLEYINSGAYDRIIDSAIERVKTSESLESKKANSIDGWYIQTQETDENIMPPLPSSTDEDDWQEQKTLEAINEKLRQELEKAQHEFELGTERLRK